MSKAKPTQQPNARELIDIPLSGIIPNPFQPRKSRDPIASVKLAVSILSNSLLQPPTGRRVGDHVELAFGMGQLSAYQLIYGVQKRLEKDQSPHPGEFGITSPDEETAQVFSSLVSLASARLDQSGMIDSMPVYVEDMTDRQMFERAISENHDRESLSDVDLARSMKAYREYFGATSEEIGRLYHMGQSGVRGLIRLLKLPDDVQTRIANGELSRGQATKLISLQGISPNLLAKVAPQIKADQPVSEVDNILTKAVMGDKSVVIMHQSYQGLPAKGGSSLWELDQFTPGEIRAELSPAALLKAFPQYVQPIIEADDSRKAKDTLGLMIEWIASSLSEYGQDSENPKELAEVKKLFSELFSNDPDLVDWVFAQVFPPVCSRCPMHRVLNGNHVCSNKDCHSWKSEKFTESEAARIAQEMGLPMYAESDGEYIQDGNGDYGYRADGSYGKIDGPFDIWLREKNPDLRILAKFRQPVCNATKSNHAVLVVVGESVKRFAELTEAKKSETIESITVDWRDNARPGSIRSESEKSSIPTQFLLSEFLWERIGYFSKHFLEIKDHVAAMILSAMSDDEGVFNPYTESYYPIPTNEKTPWRQNIIAHRAIMDWAAQDDGAYFSGSLEYVCAMLKDELSESLAADLPETWLQDARDYERSANQ